MKTNAFLFVLAFVFFAFYTCDTPPGEKIKDGVDQVKEVLPVGIVQNSTTLTEDTIHVNTATDWAQRWETKVNGGGYMATSPLYAFDIPHEDVSEIFSNSEAKTFRVYMGLTAQDTFKAIVVGVNKDGIDLIDSTKSLFVYDLSTPCPPICDTSSVMYQAYNKQDLTQ